MLRKCIYGGGDQCSRQGGDGTLHHREGYMHPFPAIDEAGEPIGEFVQKSHSTEETHSLAGFDINFDEDKSYEVLSLEISKGISVNNLLKSLYEFDFDSDDAIQKVLQLLPILDPEILVGLVEKLWPGYAVQEEDPDLLRAEIKGYLLDYLEEQ